MKRYIIALSLFVSCALNAAQGATNLISIHLVAENIFPQWELGTMPKPGSLKLISPPVLADADFVSFNHAKQTFTITPEAATRLSKTLWERVFGDEPPTILNGGVYTQIPSIAAFVLKASDEPIYVGTFNSDVSSSSFAGPAIMADAMFISTNLTTNVTFHIRPGYPWEFPGIADQMRDPRIELAVRKLFPYSFQKTTIAMISIIAALIIAVVFLIFPGLGSRLRFGTGEFRKASDQVTQQLRGDDDDDTPHPA